MSTPKPAATVLLLRPAPADARGHAFEIFMVRRSGRARFMPDAMVYPGGRLEDQDHDPALAARCDLSAAEAEARLQDPDGLALLIAGLRETFEEAGVLLARGRDGAELADDARLEAARADLNAGRRTFAAVLDELDAVLRCDALRYVARWITPEVEPRRYDARFLMAEAPRAQAPSHDGGETTDSGWWRPAAALAACDAGEILMGPPTIRVLMALNTVKTIPEALALRDGPPPAITPQGIQGPEGLILYLPGDPEYVGAPITGRDRFTQAGGRWRSEGESW